MSLINCPECSKKVSDKAVACPNCGFPILQHQNSLNFHIMSDEEIHQRELDFIKKAQNEPYILDKVLTPFETRYKPCKAPFINDDIAVFEYDYKTETLWLSYCHGYYTDNVGNISEGYICDKCYRVKIECDGSVINMYTGQNYGKINSKMLENKMTSEDETIAYHTFPHYDYPKENIENASEEDTSISTGLLFMFVIFIIVILIICLQIFLQ